MSGSRAEAVPASRFAFGLLDQPTRGVSFRCGEVRPLAPDIHSRIRALGEQRGWTPAKA